MPMNNVHYRIQDYVNRERNNIQVSVCAASICCNRPSIRLIDRITKQWAQMTLGFIDGQFFAPQFQSASGDAQTEFKKLHDIYFK